MGLQFGGASPTCSGAGHDAYPGDPSAARMISHGKAATDSQAVPRLPSADPSSSTYQHWGVINGTGGSTTPEPNQLGGAENCGAGNSSQAFGKAWGWSDADCMQPAVSICKYMRGWRCHDLCVAADAVMLLYQLSCLSANAGADLPLHIPYTACLRVVARSPHGLLLQPHGVSGRHSQQAPAAAA